MNQALESKITHKEAKEALFTMDPDKALGPDAFLTLIPKEKGANSFNIFHPISLCNIGYKVITKVIANRLKRILPKIIPDNQGGFIQGRQLVDNFVLVQEAIHSNQHRKEKGMQEQDIASLCIARGVKCINHALFANDTLLLGVASPHSAIKFKAVLDDYCKVSGSVLNKGKCQIYYWNIPASTANSIARCLGFAASITWSSFKYLDLPIFNKRALSKDWSSQLDKFKAKMQARGSSWLNIASKAVLIKAVLSSLPIFKFSVLLAPMGIIKKMEELIRQFFWKGGKQNDKRFSLVN
eukprot:PITA_03968